MPNMKKPINTNKNIVNSTSKDLRGPNKKNTVSLLTPYSKESNKYTLTTRHEFSSLKEEVLGSFFPSDIIPLITQYLLPHNTFENTPNSINLLSSFFEDEPTILLLFSSESKLYKKYRALIKLYVLRLQVMHSSIAQGGVLEAGTDLFTENLCRYATAAFDRKYSIKEVKELLQKVSSADVAIFQANRTKILAGEITIIPEIYALLNAVSELHTKIFGGFKSCYFLYKAHLDLVFATMRLRDVPLFEASRNLLFSHLEQALSPGSRTFCDHHYLLHLVRVHVVNVTPQELYKHPAFNELEAKQVTGYLTEIYNTSQLIAAIILKNKVIFGSIFRDLPISKTINKSPSLFFGQPISRNTFSSLLDYLGLANTALTKTLLEVLNKNKVNE